MYAIHFVNAYGVESVTGSFACMWLAREAIKLLDKRVAFSAWIEREVS